MKIFETDELLNEVTGYHGSPYNFEEFDTKFIGTGEGAQAHGWGLYFALEYDVAKSNYGSDLNHNETKAYKTITYNNMTFESGTQAYKLFNIIKTKGKSDALNMINDYLNDSSYIQKHPDYVKKLNKLKDIISSIDDEQIDSITLKAGQNYTVELPNLNSMLYEDLTYRNQPENVKKAIDKFIKQFPTAKAIKSSGTSGGRIYKIMSHTLDGDKDASLWLLDNEIPGIYYNGSRDGQCCVIFSGKDVKIINKEIKSSNNDLKMDINTEDVRNLTEEDVASIKNPSQEFQDAVIKYMPEYYNYLQKVSRKTARAASEINARNIMKLADINGFSNYDNAINFNLTEDDLLYALQFKDGSSLLIDDIILNDAMRKKFYNADFLNKCWENKNIQLMIKNVLNYDYEDILNNIDFSKLDKSFIEYILPKIINNKKFLVQAIPYISEKMKNKIIFHNPLLLKYLKSNEISEQLKMKIIQKNPFNIRYIENPSKDLIQKAFELNPDTKDYIRN